jgi:hypothetical protein
MMYASRTGTRRNLAALRDAGWRLLVSPAGCVRTEGFRYAMDNGAWSYHQKGLPFDDAAFLRCLDLVGTGADWIVIPDRVGDAAGTFEMLAAWWPRLRGAGLLLFALQDGMSEPEVERALRPGMGLFLGGSTEYKEGTARLWGRFARERALYFHVGRVNTVRRISIAAEAGADSIDGTSVTMFSANVRRLSNAGAQPAFAWSELGRSVLT